MSAADHLSSSRALSSALAVALCPEAGARPPVSALKQLRTREMVGERLTAALPHLIDAAWSAIAEAHDGSDAGSRGRRRREPRAGCLPMWIAEPIASLLGWLRRGRRVRFEEVRLQEEHEEVEDHLQELQEDEVGPDDSISVFGGREADATAAEVPVTIEGPDGTRHPAAIWLPGVRSMPQLRRGMLGAYNERLKRTATLEQLRVQSRRADGTTLLLTDLTPLSGGALASVSFYVWCID